MSGIENALNELEVASAALAEARERLNSARREECDCINRVNKAQKALDEIIAKTKALAPSGSDWKTQRRDVVSEPKT